MTVDNFRDEIKNFIIGKTVESFDAVYFGVIVRFTDGTSIDFDCGDFGMYADMNEKDD